MGLNPLKVPRWKSKVHKPRPVPMARWKVEVPSGPPPPPTAPRTPYLTREEELAGQAKKAKQTITVDIRSVQGHRGGSFVLAWEGGQLGRYFSKMEVKHLAINNAVYDTTNLEKGRLRLTYRPEPGAHILIGPAALGPNSHLQRQQGSDPRPKKGGPKDEDVSMRYGSASKPKEAGVDDIDIEQF